jgi:peptidoglycan/LPS O-acetylase OafA/YrhL
LRPKRPGRLWLFFWGRRRRGFPGLLVTVLALAVVLGLSYASHAGAAVSYLVGLGFLALIGLLAVVALVAGLVGALRPPGGR